jgi:hypothetical protein
MAKPRWPTLSVSLPDQLRNLAEGALGRLGSTDRLVAFFATISGSIDVKVIYAPQLGPERKCVNAWHKSRSSLYHLDDAYDSILLPRPRLTSNRQTSKQ